MTGAEEQKNIYDSKYRVLSTGNKSGTRQLQYQHFCRLLQNVKASPDRACNILDIGGGCGGLGDALNGVLFSGKAIQYTNFELSTEGCLRSSEKGHSTIQGAITETSQLPFGSQVFDIVHCSHVIEHLVNPDVLLIESKRVMKPGGILYVATPNMASWIGRLFVLFGYQGYGQEVSVLYPLAGKGALARRFYGKGGAGYHLRLFTLTGLRDIMRLHGFTNIKSFGLPAFGFASIGRPLDILANGVALADRVFSRIDGLASNIIVSGRLNEEA